MNIVVNKDEILEKLNTKRAQHVEVYELANKAYRLALVSALKEYVEKAEAGENVGRYSIKLPEAPSNYVEEYDQAIAMVEMSEGDSVELDSSDFKCFVLDKWHWKNDFIGTAVGYEIDDALLCDEVGFAVDSYSAL